MMHRPLRYAIGLIITPVAAMSQTIRGTVVDRANAPVSGVVAQLLDSTSRVVARQLSNASGAFRLTAPRAGSYRIQTLRIGFTPTLSGVHVLKQGEEQVEPITLAGVQLSFDTIRVVGQSSCRVAKDTAAATFAIWQQVRTALTATDITTSDRSVFTTAVVYDRTLDPAGRKVLTHGSTIRSGYASQPWSGMTPEGLGRQGYVATDSTGATTYYAPSIEVLLSDRFLEDHCLLVGTESTRIAVRFEPTRERKDLPEIRGTVWLDRASLELRRMEYRYANIPVEQEVAGGNLEFARLTDGAWVISKWHIDMPVLELRRFSINLGGQLNKRSQEIRVREIAERGGELSLARRRADTLWSRPPLVFSGVVRDTTSGAGVGGAYVTVQGTSASGVADSAGYFSLHGLLPGDYGMEVRTASLDSVGAAHRLSRALTDTLLAPILVPTASMYSARMCGATRMTGMRAGIIVGGVKAAVDSIAVNNLPVVAQWDAPASGVSRVVARTDSTGAFRLCGMPLDGPVTLSTESHGESSEPLAVRIPHDRLLASVQLTVDPPRGATLTGLVRADSTSARPVANADVTLTDIGKSVTTDAKGAFRMTGIPPGEHRLSVRRIGYTPAEAVISFSANARITRDVEITRVALLDSMRVVAQSRYMRSFEEHRATGLGHFLTRDDLAKKEGQSFTSVVAEVLGFKIAKGRSTHAWVTSSRRPPSFFGHGLPNRLDDADVVKGAKRLVCYSHVYLDDVRVYGGREAEPLFDLSSISPEKIEAIEFYSSPAQLPNKYAGLNTACGVMVIWTRRNAP